jgi:ribosomal protein L40E
MHTIRPECRPIPGSPWLAPQADPWMMRVCLRLSGGFWLGAVLAFMIKPYVVAAWFALALCGLTLLLWPLFLWEIARTTRWHWQICPQCYTACPKGATHCPACPFHAP